MAEITRDAQWSDKGAYKEPKDADNIRAPRVEIDDATTYIDKDGSNNLTLTDAVTGTKTLAELSAGGGDVSAAANITDHAIVRGDGGAKGVQSSLVTIDDNGVIDVGTYGVRLNPTNKEIQFGTGAAWNVRLKYGEAGTVYVWNAENNYYGHLIANYLKTAAGVIFLSSAASITGAGGDDQYITGTAKDNGVGNVEIWRMQGAADPYFQATLPMVLLPVATASLPAAPVEGMIAYDATLDKLVYYNGAAWVDPSAAGGGDVTGPASSTDNEIARQHSTTGKVLQTYTSNPPTISDTGDVNIDGDLDVENIVVSGNVDGIDVSALDAAVVKKADYNAQTILQATTDDTPAALTVTEQTLVGRITSGNIAALSTTQIRTLINVADGATAYVDADAVAAVNAAGFTPAENFGVVLDAALSADEKWSGIVELGTMGYGATVGELMYLDGVGANNKWEKTNATAAATSKGKLGLCTATTNENSTCNVLLYGKMRSAQFPALTVGAPVHVSEATAGLVQVAAPTGTTNFVVRIIGYGSTAEDLFFCPDNSYIELA